MARARKIVLSSRSFNSFGDAKTFFTMMLNRYNIDERVSDEDAVDLHALIARHDQPEEKIGSGIDYFEVKLPPDFAGRCFWAVWHNGYKVDFSITHCLKAHPDDEQ